MFLVADGMIKSPRAADQFRTNAEMLETGTKKILQVEKCKAIDSLVSKHPSLEFKSLHDWQPMKFIMHHMLNIIIAGYTTKETASGQIVDN